MRVMLNNWAPVALNVPSEVTSDAGIQGNILERIICAWISQYSGGGQSFLSHTYIYEEEMGQLSHSGTIKLGTSEKYDFGH